MPVYKDEKRGTWWVSVRYTNWAGQPDRKVKRGFSRERDAKAWERDFLFQQSRSCDMTVSALWELYREDDRARLRESTRDSKDSTLEKALSVGSLIALLRALGFRASACTICGTQMRLCLSRWDMIFRCWRHALETP